MYMKEENGNARGILGIAWTQFLLKDPSQNLRSGFDQVRRFLTQPQPIEHEADLRHRAHSRAFIRDTKMRNATETANLGRGDMKWTLSFRVIELAFKTAMCIGFWRRSNRLLASSMSIGRKDHLVRSAALGLGLGLPGVETD